MSRLLCCLRARHTDMGAALSLPQEGEACDGAGLPAAPPTMADVIRERKKKAGGAGLGTLRRRIANAARRPRDTRPDRGCEHARFIRSVVSPWRLAEVFLLCEELEAGAALRDLATQADLAREPAPALHMALPAMYTDRWWCDVELVGAGWALPAHRAVLAARSTYLRDLLQRYPPSCSRVPLEGACASLPREEADACLLALYGGGGAPSRRPHCRPRAKYDGAEHCESDLDLVDNTSTCRSSAPGGCACVARRGAARRAAALLGVSRDPLHTSMRYLLDSGEMSDAKLVFRLESGCGAAYGFRTALELPCHRVVLAARSRFFRSVMSRRGREAGGGGGGAGGGGGGAVCVDEGVLPRRFARALLHAAYTDQVDLSLIGRSPTQPAAASGAAASAWSGAGRGGSGGSRLTVAGLDDAFQLYEIARFLEMPIVVQGCEDAIAESLTPDTLPHVLRWASAPHASQWVHRQAMRYLRDEFVCITGAGGGGGAGGAGGVPRAALAAALASPFLQASEPAALRALLRWGADHKHKPREPNVVWHTAHSVSRRGARRRELSDAALREILAPLVAHVRLEHIPPNNELLQQLVRRGIVPPPAPLPAGESSAHAWLGRGSCRPARCFLPYLDEIKALLEDQAVPEAELARLRRARYMHRIPDTLYMVAAARNPPPAALAGAGEAGEAGAAGVEAAGACVAPRARAQLRARVRELRAAPSARTAARNPQHRGDVRNQIALRAVREMSLPDACAELLLGDMDDTNEQSNSDAWESPGAERRLPPEPEGCEGWRGDGGDCCRTVNSSGSLRCAGGSLRAPRHHTENNSRAGTCGRRELPTRTDPLHRRAGASWEPAPAPGPEPAPDSRLSAAVPDVAMAPNGNTHLLTARDYCRHPPPWEYGGGGGGVGGVGGAGVVLQLDLGDGATHTPRPGSRAARNSTAAAPRQRDRDRDHHQLAQAMSCLRRSDEDELRAAIELSVIRAYSSFHTARGGAGGGGAGRAGAGAGRRGGSATLPPPARGDLPPSTSSGASPRPPARGDLPPHLALSRLSPSPSPRRRDYPHHDYRVEGAGGSYGGSASTSRGHSPNNYA